MTSHEWWMNHYWATSSELLIITVYKFFLCIRWIFVQEEVQYLFLWVKLLYISVIVIAAESLSRPRHDGIQTCFEFHCYDGTNPFSLNVLHLWMLKFSVDLCRFSISQAHSTCVFPLFVIMNQTYFDDNINYISSK